MNINELTKRVKSEDLNSEVEKLTDFYNRLKNVFMINNNSMFIDRNPTSYYSFQYYNNDLPSIRTFWTGTKDPSRYRNFYSVELDLSPSQLDLKDNCYYFIAFQWSYFINYTETTGNLIFFNTHNVIFHKTNHSADQSVSVYCRIEGSKWIQEQITSDLICYVEWRGDKKLWIAISNLEGNNHNILKDWLANPDLGEKGKCDINVSIYKIADFSYLAN